MTHFYKSRKDDPLVWVDTEGNKLPPHAVEGGFDLETLYDGRALHKNDTILLHGKIKLSSNSIHISWGNAEHTIVQYQALTNPKNASLSWVKYNGDVPEGAVKGGEQNNNVPLYIGRIMYNHELLIGKIHQFGEKAMYVSYNGEEKKFTIPEDTFSILVVHRTESRMKRIGNAVQQPAKILFEVLRIAWLFLK